MSNYSVYTITGPTGLAYVGITANYKTRLQAHKAPRAGCTQLVKDKAAFGWKAFVCEELHRNLSKEDALAIERDLITTMGTTAPNGYNKRDEADYQAWRLDTKRRRTEAKSLADEAKRLRLEERNCPPPYKDAKPTKNRKVIIKCLTEPNSDCGGLPPYSADSIHYMLEGNFKWYGAKKPVSISQINRTLRDLFRAGLIVKRERIDEPLEGGLPSRVNYWQMAESVGRNELLTKVQNACKTASEAHGTFLFSTSCFFNKPFDAKQKQAIVCELKILMQQTHPDKVPGFEDEFICCKQALTYVRSNIDLLKNPKARWSVACQK